MKNFEVEVSDDISMAPVDNTTDDEICIVGEAQGSQEKEVNLDNIEEYLHKFKESLEESSTTKKDKGKAIMK